MVTLGKDTKQLVIFLGLIAIAGFLLMGFNWTDAQTSKFTGALYVENMDGTMTPLTSSGVPLGIVVGGTPFSPGQKLIIIPSANIMATITPPSNASNLGRNMTIQISATDGIKSSTIGTSDIKSLWNLRYTLVSGIYYQDFATTWSTSKITVGANGIPATGSWNMGATFTGNQQAIMQNGAGANTNWGRYEVTYAQISGYFPTPGQTKTLTVVLTGTFTLFIDGVQQNTATGEVTLTATIGTDQFTGSVSIGSWTATTTVGLMTLGSK